MIFDLNKIRHNDPLREKKINALNSIKNEFESLDKDINDVEQLRNFIRKYVCQNWGAGGDRELIVLKTNGGQSMDKWERKYSFDFQTAGGGWIWEQARQKIVDVGMVNGVRDEETSEEEVGKVIERLSNIVKKAIRENGSQLAKALKELREKTSDLSEWDVEGFEKRCRDEDYFNKHGSYEGTRWGKKWNYAWAYEILHKKYRDKKQEKWFEEWKEEERRLLEEKARKFKEEATITQRETVEKILSEIREAQFRQEWLGKYKNMVVWPEQTNCYGCTRHDTISHWKTITEDWINRLDDDLLEDGKKKVDLLGELNETISSKASFLNDDNASEITIETSSTSLFGGSDNSSFTSIEEENDNNKKDIPEEETIEQVGDRVIQEINTLLEKNPISDSEIEEICPIELIREYTDDINLYVKGNLSFSEKCATINGIKSRIKNVVEAIVSLRKKTANLDNLSEKFENGSEKVEINDIATFNQNSGDDKNKEKEQKAKENMMKSEEYTEAFISWVKIEERKLEDSNFKLEYTEEQKEFLKGKVADPIQKEQISSQIETKINVEKKSRGLKEFLKKVVNFVKDKVKKVFNKGEKEKVEQEAIQIIKKLESAENSSNLYERAAYEENKQQVSELRMQLNSLLQDNQQVPEKSLFRPEVMVLVSLVAMLAVVATVMIRRKKRIK
jgi:hypothetical protein